MSPPFLRSFNWQTAPLPGTVLLRDLQRSLLTTDNISTDTISTHACISMHVNINAHLGYGFGKAMVNLHQLMV
jgi:hypothetical protein